MLVFKCLGGVVLLVIGWRYCQQIMKDSHLMQRRLDAWIALLAYVRGQICCFGRPLPDILATADRKVLEALEIDAAQGSSLSEYCRADAQQLGVRGGELLGALAEELGTVWRQEQVERLDYYITALEEESRSYQAKRADMLRVRCTLTLCGIGGVLLLVW